VTWKRPNASLLGRERFAGLEPNRTLPTTYNLAYCAPPEPLSLTPSGEWTAWVKSSSGAAAATVNTLYGDRLGWAKVSVCQSAEEVPAFTQSQHPSIPIRKHFRISSTRNTKKRIPSPFVWPVYCTFCTHKAPISLIMPVIMASKWQTHWPNCLRNGNTG